MPQNICRGAEIPVPALCTTCPSCNIPTSQTSPCCVAGLAHLDRPDDGGEVARKRDAGHDVLRVIEQHLAAQPYFAGDHYTIADISLYAYTHVADEGIALSRDPLGRIAVQPGHIAIDDDCGFPIPGSR